MDRVLISISARQQLIIALDLVANQAAKEAC